MAEDFLDDETDELSNEAFANLLDALIPGLGILFKLYSAGSNFSTISQFNLPGGTALQNQIIADALATRRKS